MSETVDLIHLGDDHRAVITWPSGNVWPVKEATPQAVQAFIREKLPHTQARAWLFWHSNLGMPDEALVTSLLSQPGNVWHAGLRLGMAGLPGAIDFVSPGWMLNRDPGPGIEATSWRVSLHACLILTDVLRQMGGLGEGFRTLAGASLEMGHRYITRGVFMRHVPALAGDAPPAPSCELPFEDELRFIYYRFGRKWLVWTWARALMTGYVSPGTVIRALGAVMRSERPANPTPYRQPEKEPGRSTGADDDPRSARVSVLIPTLDRYPYLRTLLDQMRAQSVPPLEILVIDQTEAERRDEAFYEAFEDLPLRVIFRDKPGQCSSRNAGLLAARGDCVLFIDDDDEVPPDLIEAHLENLSMFEGQVSSGAAHEVGAGPLPEPFTYLRASDVFPTNNTLIQRGVLGESGLFDLAYDHAARADQDLGMRIYLSGAVMVYNPDIAVLHHHAPRGGLRSHKARVITYASSRRRLTHRHLPSVSEIYLLKRYFTERQVRESLWLRALGTFSVRGGVVKKLLKVLVSLFLLPDTWWQIRQRSREADRWLESYPRIPALEDDGPEDMVAVKGAV